MKKRFDCEETRLNIGDLIYHKHLHTFGTITASGFNRKNVCVTFNTTDPESDVRNIETGIWICENIVKLDIDTPQNRLAIQLKYTK